MEKFTRQTSQYIITAWTSEGVLQQTRTEAAGAVVLALTLREAGYSVEVVDPMGTLLSSDRTSTAFRVLREQSRIDLSGP